MSNDTKVTPINAKAAIKRPVDVQKLTDKELVIVFTDATLEMKRRCHDLKGLSMHDDRGRLWSMPALMRHIGHAFNYMQISFGSGLVK